MFMLLTSNQAYPQKGVLLLISNKYFINYEITTKNRCELCNLHVTATYTLTFKNKILTSNKQWF